MVDEEDFEVYNQILEENEMNFSLDSIENNENKYIDDEERVANESNNINDFNNKTFKSSMYAFENNLQNFDFFKNKEKLVQINKIKSQFSITLHKSGYSYRNKDLNFSKLYPNMYRCKIQNIEGKKEEKIFDFNLLYPYLKKKDYYDYIFVWLIIKYNDNFKNKIKVDSKIIYIHNKEINNTGVEDLKKELVLLNKEINSDSRIIKLTTDDKFYFDSSSEEIIKLINEVGNFFNVNNQYLLNFLYMCYSFKLFQDIKTYKIWKLYLGRLIALWDLKDLTGMKDKYTINEMLVKRILFKLFKCKEKEELFNYKVTIRSKKKMTNLLDLGAEVSGNPRLSLTPESNLLLLFNIIYDVIFCILFFFLPFVFIQDYDNDFIFIIYLIANSVYFINIVKGFRFLTLDNMGNQINEITVIFINMITDWTLIIDIISIFPFDLLFYYGPLNEISQTYYVLKVLYLLRYFKLGNSLALVEKTNYASELKLIILLGKFIFICHWFGVFYISYFLEFFFNSKFNRESNCYENFQETDITFHCLFSDTLYIGGYAVMGKNIELFNFFDSWFGYFQFHFLFTAYFIGQFITATVFSGVSDILDSMNAAENKYKEIKDEYRIIDHFFKIDDQLSLKFQNYFSYLWLKHKEDIYGKQLFHKMSKGLKNIFNRSMIQGISYILKDINKIPTVDNKFLDFFVGKLKKYIAIPYERVTTQGSVIKGLFILYNGKLYSTDEPELNHTRSIYQFDFKESGAKMVKKEISVRKDEKRLDLESIRITSKKIVIDKIANIESKVDKLDNTMSGEDSLFPLDAIFIKTGRAIETSYTKEYCDLFYIPLEVVDKFLIPNFPSEMYALSIKGKKTGQLKVGNDAGLLKIILEHSCRSVGKYYEDEYNLENMWIETPLTLPKFRLKFLSEISNQDKNSNTGYRGLLEINTKLSRMNLYNIIKLHDQVE